MAKFLITSDWHLRLDNPKCRQDNFLETQKFKLNWIDSLILKQDMTILNAGDIFHKARSSQELESWSIKNLPKTHIITVAGNHDLPYHSKIQYINSSLSVLESCNKVSNVLDIKSDIFAYLTYCNVIVYGFSWGNNLDEWIEKVNKNLNNCSQKYNKKIALMHLYVDDGNEYWTDEIAMKTDFLMKKLSMFDLIITGHNHKPFVKKNENQILINPGSITRQKAIDNFRPRVYIWDSVNNNIFKEYIPLKLQKLSTEYLEKVKEENNRIKKFVNNLNDKSIVDLDFLKNLDNFYMKNKIDEDIKNMISSCLI